MSAPAPAAVGAGSEAISAPIIVRPGVQSVTVSGTKFEVSSRYRIIKPVGHGAYGVVVYVANVSCRVCPCGGCVPARACAHETWELSSRGEPVVLHFPVSAYPLDCVPRVRTLPLLRIP
jgi:hypothetical protein